MIKMALDVGAMYAATYSTFLFIVVLVLAFLFNKGGAVGWVESAAFSSLRFIISFIPYALIGWGILISFLTLEFKYMVAPLYGLQALVLCIAGAFVFGKFLPGFVASSSAILTFYTYDYLVKNITGNIVKNIMVSLFSFLVLLAQLLTSGTNIPGAYLFNADLLNDGLAAILGVSVGLGGWYTIHSTNPDMLPYTGQQTKKK